MYISKAFRESDTAKLVDFMQAHSFAILAAVLEGRPVAAHIPVVVETSGGQITLRGHVARTNPIWKAFGGEETLAIFSGPHAYVSPSAYEKRESVPTWNYIAVHAYGIPRAVHFGENADAMREILDELIDTNEPAYRAQWDSLPDSFREGLMQGVVGFEMPVSRLEGQYKLSQNRSHTDQHNVADTLAQGADPAAIAVAEAMRLNLTDR